MYRSIDAALVAAMRATGVTMTDVYLDWAPSGAVPPYVTYNGNVNTAPAMRGDSKALRYSRQAQFDYWTTVKDDVPSSITLIREGLNGVRYQLVGGEFIRISLISVLRVPEPMGDNLCHHVITVETRHSPAQG